ncbi:hypothetical protein [Saccharopolyspora rectivirgula]|nr:hypothetical protein [Saccharopolyspora rectivirgula]
MINWLPIMKSARRAGPFFPAGISGFPGRSTGSGGENSPGVNVHGRRFS